MPDSDSDRQLQGQPLVIMGDDAERTKGSDAQDHNIQSARAVSDAVRTTLGPQGMDKMLAEGDNIVITNDGATILDKMDIDNHTAEMIVEVAETQEEEAGDGTTTSVVLAGELLHQAGDLLDQDVHSTVIVDGYREAAERAAEVLDDLAVEVTDERLRQVAETSMTGRGTDYDREWISDLLVDAVRQVEADGSVDLDRVKTESTTGGSLEDSELVSGAALDVEPAHSEMPATVDGDALLLEGGIAIQETETDAEISVETADQLQDVIGREEEQLEERVQAIADLGVDVLFAGDDVADTAVHYLNRHGILTFDGVDDDDLAFLAASLDTQVASDVENATDADVAPATVEHRDGLTYVEGPEARGVTILLRGGTEHVVEEIERGTDDALAVLANAVEDGQVLPGGAAPESEVALRLRDHADGVGGRKQLAVEAFADALDVVPRTIAENAGLDPIDAVVALRNAHDGGAQNDGLDVETGGTIDALDAGIVDSFSSKRQAVEGAENAASMILRIDDIIAGG